MTPERWRQIEELYHAALARDAAERTAWLAEACADDEPLRREVETLLVTGSTDGFLSDPATALAAQLASGAEQSTLTGRRLGVYQVLALLGVGGMGEVYRARDTKLGRDVAIKRLSREFANDRDRLARFEREARLLASLNHPNISAIYGLEAAPGADAAPFIVMELVDGETLAEKLAGSGHGPVQSPKPNNPSLSIRESLAIARQLTEALEAAHERGIVHRDLKPANIKITPTGVVKVLDFGLAKGGAETAGVELSLSPTTTAHGTREGVILGTAAYMSPEQARGQVVDKRTDIWAFGCVLYEMLAGRRAFVGATISDTIAAILEREPEWTALPAAVPPNVERLLRRCLQKDTKRRTRDIADSRIELDEPGNETGVERASVTVASSRRGLLPWLTAAAALTALALIAVAASQVGFTRSDGAPAFSRAFRLTSGPAREWAPAISPDGKWVAYLSNERGPTDVWVRFVGGGEPANLTASTGLEVTPGTGIGGLDISPDGARIAAMARMRGSSQAFETWEIPAPLPGPPRKVLDAGFLGLRWSPDGRRITFIRSGGAAGDALWVANADGTNRREIIKLHGGVHIHWPAWSADGAVYFIRTIAPLLNMEPSGIARVYPDSGTIELILGTSRRAVFPSPMPDGRGLIYAANPNTADLGLWWQPSTGGASRRLTSGVGEYAEPRVSGDGRTLVCTLYDVRQSLIRVSIDEDFGAVTPISSGFTGDLDPSLGPSNDRLVFSSSRTGIRHLWTSMLDASNAHPLTSGASLDEAPQVSPDGKQIAFLSDRDGRRAIWLISVDGGEPRKLADAEVGGGISWSREGNELLFAAADGERTRLWALPATASARPREISTAASDAVGNAASNPVTDTIAYIAATMSGAPMQRVAFVSSNGTVLFGALAPPPPETLIGGGFGNGVLAWSPDGKRLAVVSQGTNTPSIWIIEPAAVAPYRKLVEFSGGPRIRGMTWTRDGRSIIIGKHDIASSDIVIMDNVQ